VVDAVKVFEQLQSLRGFAINVLNINLRVLLVRKIKKKNRLINKINISSVY